MTDNQFRVDLPTPQKIRRVREVSEKKIETTKTLKTWLFLAVTATALIFTGLTSYSLIYTLTAHRGVFQANVAAVAGIALTDGMLLYWTLIGFRKADSGTQRITAGLMAGITVTAIGIFGIGEQMLADQFVNTLQMRYIVTFFVVAQIVGITIYELTSYEAKLAMATYMTNMRTVQLLDKAAAEEADSYADVILSEAQSRANFAYMLADQVRHNQPKPELEAPTTKTEVIIEAAPEEAPTEAPTIAGNHNGNGSNAERPKVQAKK